MTEQDDHWFSDTDALADELARASKRVRARSGIAHVEIYHRISRTIRVTAPREGDAVATRAGWEEGTALRLWGAGESDLRFVATSGGAPESIDRAVDRALSDEGRQRAAPADRCVREATLVDRDGDAVVLPGPDRLAAWLVDARQFLSSTGDAGAEPARLWIEVASTCETWVGDGSIVGSRWRARGWALLEPASGEGGSSAPRILAARSWKDIDPRDWLRMEPPRPRLGLPRSEMPAGPIVVIFSPEASATLILALVRAAPAEGARVETGPGFRVRDAPEEPGALFGGQFDDLGFPTRPTRVGDGHRVLDSLLGPGHYRRPSFRDVPACFPANLVVEPPGTEAPATGLRVHRVGVHPLAPARWALEVDGTWWTGGEPRGAVRGACISTAPRELLARCTAGAGEPFASHRGVRTPALLFEGLTVTS